jgi:hypothetical protein
MAGQICWEEIPSVHSNEVIVNAPLLFMPPRSMPQIQEVFSIGWGIASATVNVHIFIKIESFFPVFESHVILACW